MTEKQKDQQSASAVLQHFVFEFRFSASMLQKQSMNETMRWPMEEQVVVKVVLETLAGRLRREGGAVGSGGKCV